MPTELTRPPDLWQMHRLWGWLRRVVVGQLHGQGTGHQPISAVHISRPVDLPTPDQALSDMPHTIDATALGFPTNIRHPPLPSPLREAMAKLPRLLAFEERIRTRFRPDWDAQQPWGLSAPTHPLSEARNGD